MSDSPDQVSVLVVDDREDRLLALEVALEDLEQPIVRARSGVDAMSQLLARDFAVILLDINMPGMDGFETASLIRQRERNRHTPIIFMTAADHELYRLRSYSLGAVDYIQTPILPEVLRSKVQVFVELAKKTAQIERQAASLERRARQLHKLASASLRISAALSLDAMLRAIADAARDTIGVHLSLMSLALEEPAESPRTFGSFSPRYGAWVSRDLAPSARRCANLVRGIRTTLRLGPEELESRIATELTGEDDAIPMRGLLAAPLNEADGRRVGVMCLSDKLDGDFTEEDEALLVQLAQVASIAIQNWIHAEAREANRRKDEFLGTLSHELRTPLQAILGWTQHLRMGGLDPTEIEHGLVVIERNANAQTKLVEDILDISRINSGKLRVELSPISFRSVVTMALEMHRPAAEAKGVALELSYETEADVVRGDANRLRQVAANILSNAIKFTPSGGRVVVRVTTHEGELELSVADTGEGIDPQFLPFVFDRFRQGDNSTRRANTGLGLGLAIVQHIVELHNGTVSVDSTGIGRGSTFTVRLPLRVHASRSAHDAQAVRSGSAVRGEQLGGVRVLVVDDDRDVREILERVLSFHGATVTATSSVQEALDALPAARPHVLVSDIAMPLQDGYDLIANVRSRGAADGGNVAALALTASASKDDHARALAAGFQLHAAKPIDPVALVAAVRALAAVGESGSA